MKTIELYNILSFDKNITSVEILSQQLVSEQAYHLVVKLLLSDGDSLNIPIIWYKGEDWVFTPWDWQSFPSTRIDEIENITWRVNDTDKTAIIINGLPRLL